MFAVSHQRQELLCQVIYGSHIPDLRDLVIPAKRGPVLGEEKTPGGLGTRTGGVKSRALSIYSVPEQHWIYRVQVVCDSRYLNKPRVLVGNYGYLSRHV